MTNNLKRQRVALRLSERELAALAGCSRSYVAVIEGGYRPPAAIGERLQHALDQAARDQIAVALAVLQRDDPRVVLVGGAEARARHPGPDTSTGEGSAQRAEE